MPVSNRINSSMETERSDVGERISLLLLTLILLIALGLRLYELNAGLWLDEILTYVNYARMPFGEIITSYDSENQHFLFSILARASFLMFGESNWALRLPAVLFGVGSILALYLLGREVANRKEALLSAALLTFSYHHVWFSQNARGYSGLLFWTILSSWLLLRALRNDRSATWILYALSAALGIYTHLTMVFVLFGQICVYGYQLIHRRKVDWVGWWKGLILGFGGAGLLTALLHGPVVSQMLGTIGGTEASVVSAWKNPLWTLLEIIKGLQVGFSSAVIVAGALFLFGAGLVSYWRNYKEVDILLLVPPLVGATVVIGAGHHLWPRFFFFSLGFAVLVVIRGAMVTGRLIGKIFKLTKTNSERIGTALCAGLIIVSALSVPFAYGPKQDYNGALDFVQANREPGDSVVAVGLAAFVYDDFYKTDWESVSTFEKLNQIRTRSNRTWLVYTFKPVLESVNPDIGESIQRDYLLIRTFEGTVGAGAVYVYRVDDHSK